MDTATVGPNEMLRVIARFEDYLGKYAYHCHILEHEDHEMMRQFEVIDSTGVATPEVTDGIALALGPNRPNPFGGETWVWYSLPQEARVTIRVFDVTGRLVEELVDGMRAAGHHEAVWRTSGLDRNPVGAGIYFIELRSGDFRAVRKATVVR